MDRRWWKEGVVYQIYPRSFYDSNGDGVGDLGGIISKLDYLKELGIDIIWLSPINQSPNVDNGYDISDYYSIMDEFGTMEDMDELIRKAHQKGLKIIMDLVVNHTSDKHHWFIKSCSSKDNPYRDFYIWRKGKGSNPPNNWGSWFGGSAWEYDEKTEEYYLHIFSRHQPDLNWDNSEVREKIYRMMEWWLNKGIDGFRMDVINLISKSREMPDGLMDKSETFGNGLPYFLNGPRVHEYLKEMNNRVLSKYDIMTVGETPEITPQEAGKYVNNDRQELNMVFHFELMGVDCKDSKWDYREFKLQEIKKIIGKWHEALKEKGWNSLFLNNHDQPRMVSRFGDDKNYRKESAKMLATLLHTLPGTPYIYQGEELGMTNVRFENIDDYQDIETLNWYQEQLEAGREKDELMAVINRIGRDNARTPMQWDDSENAGFTTGQPWLRVNPNYREINAAKERKDPTSVFNYYKRLIELRKTNLPLIYGSYQPILEDDPKIFAYFRELKGDKILVILNFSGEKIQLSGYSNTINELPIDKYIPLISNYEVTKKDILDDFILRPYEARVYRIESL